MKKPPTRLARALRWLNERADGWSCRKIARRARRSVRTVQLELAWLRSQSGDSSPRRETQYPLLVLDVHYADDGSDGHTGTNHLRSLKRLPVFPAVRLCRVCNAQVWLAKPICSYHKPTASKGDDNGPRAA